MGLTCVSWEEFPDGPITLQAQAGLGLAGSPGGLERSGTSFMSLEMAAD